MRRFLVNPTQISEKEVSILGSEAKHLSKVLRIKEGEKVLVLDGLGSSYLIQLEEVAEEGVRGRILEEISLASEPPLEVTLVQSILKGEKMDWVVQKATELGITRFVPLVSDRTIVKLNPAKALDRQKRWEKIAQEAVKQCGRALVPEIAPVKTLEEVIKEFAEGELVILPWEGEQAQGLKEVLEESSQPQKVSFFIGPEGGFSQEEVEKAQRAGAKVVSLGPRILRAETAALAVSSIILYTLGDLG